MIIECTQCQSDILTEADPYLYQNTARGEVFTCMACVKTNLNNKYRKALEEIKDQFTNISYSLIDPQEKLEDIFKISKEALKDE